jgi:hypothetical protein
MEEKYYDYFKSKLDKLPELRQYNSSINNPNFEKWWGSIKATCERMGEKYTRRANRIRFFPQVLSSGNDATYINERYQSGLNQAGAFLETLMEELQTWGLDDSNGTKASAGGVSPEQPFNLYLTISQQQAQQIIQTINLDDYDAETKQQVNILFTELSKKDKDKTKIASIVKWLADKSVDALIAILLAKANLT